MMRALVVAGRAMARLDQVRNNFTMQIEGGKELPISYWIHEIDNIFKGRLGHYLAAELLAQGFEVTLLTSSPTDVADGLKKKVSLCSFKTFDDLEGNLDTLLSQDPWDLVIMSAAPPDYQPTLIQGKMASDADVISISYRKTPKLIDRIRKVCGEKTFIVGFKLLVGVTTQKMEDVGKAQVMRAHTDLCVGNDLEKIDPKTDAHPMQLIFPDQETIFLEGTKSVNAKTLVSIVLSKIDSRKTNHV